MAQTRCVGFEQITGLSSAKGLTGAAGASYAIIQAETQDVRFRADGSDPTSSVGGVIAAGGSLKWDSDFTQIKFIESAASAKLNVHYFV